MSAYFTTHHFAPRWTSPKDKGPEGETPQGKEPVPHEAHHMVGVEALGRLLHAISLPHYGHHESEIGEGEGGGSHIAGVHKTVRPRFDLVETFGAYTLYGELAGMEQEDVSVEVDDQHASVTLTGLLSRPTPPLGNASVAAVREGNLAVKGVGVGGSSIGVVHQKEGRDEKKDTKHDEEEKEMKKEEEQQQQQQKPNEEGEAAEAGPSEAKEGEKEKEEEEENKESDDEMRWHVLERKVGKFHRVFLFPSDLADMSAVHAYMCNGLITVVVPKKKGMEGKKPARKVPVASGRRDPYGGMILSP